MNTNVLEFPETAKYYDAIKAATLVLDIHQEMIGQDNPVKHMVVDAMKAHISHPVILAELSSMAVASPDLMTRVLGDSLTIKLIRYACRNHPDFIH